MPGLATVQDAQFTSWWHGYPKPDSNKIYTHPTQISIKSVNKEKQFSCAPYSFQAGALLSQQKQS